MAVRFYLFLICFMSSLSASLPMAQTNAKQVFLLDTTTNTILFQKNADQIMFPSSMIKILTLYIVFEGLEKKRFTLEDTFPVSEKAWRMKGSKMFVKVNQQISVLELIRGVATVSGNDACIVLAEAIAGSEDAFAEMMTQKAKELGAKDTFCPNSNGWPDQRFKTTAKDLTIISMQLLRKFPQYYYLFGEKEFEFNKIKQNNRNVLLGKVQGVDGIKTGHTDDAGYGIVLSAERQGRRLILVVNGYESPKDRAKDSENLLNYGFREFESGPLIKAGMIIGAADVWLGNQSTISLMAAEDKIITYPRRSRQGMKAELVYHSPISAPIKKGDEVAQLIITFPDIEEIKVPLYAAQDVGRAPFWERIPAAINHLIWGHN